MMGGAQAPDFDAPLSQWTSYRSVNPANLVKFTEEPDLNIGLIARRRKLSSDIVFTGDDYAFFLHYQRRRSLRCEEFYISTPIFYIRCYCSLSFTVGGWG